MTSEQQELWGSRAKDLEQLDSESKNLAAQFYSETPQNWKFGKLDNLVDEFIDYRGKTPPKSDEGIHMLSAANIKDGFILPKRKEKFVSEETYEEWTTRGIPSKDDVIITTEAPVGEVGIIRSDETFLTAQRLITLRSSDGLDPHYLKFCLQYERTQQQLGSYASGTTVSSFNQTDLRNTVIPVPPISEQKKIGDILDNIERKININDRMDVLLGEIAQAVFESRFVDFSQYDNLVETELGKIPEEFDVKDLNEVLSFQRGYSYSGDELIDEESEKSIDDGYPMVNLGNISPGGGYRPENIKYCKNVPHERYLAEPGDLVISHTDMTQDRDILGSPVVIPKFNVEHILFSHHLYAIRDTDLPIEYLYYYFLSPYFKPKAESFASGTTVLSFSSKITSEVKIPIPSKESLESYLRIARPIFERREAIRREKELLLNLRDTLLPRLMSGEVRVNNINLEDLEVDSEV